MPGRYAPPQFELRFHPRAQIRPEALDWEGRNLPRRVWSRTVSTGFPAMRRQLAGTASPRPPSPGRIRVGCRRGRCGCRRRPSTTLPPPMRRESGRGRLPRPRPLPLMPPPAMTATKGRKRFERRNRKKRSRRKGHWGRRRFFPSQRLLMLLLLLVVVVAVLLLLLLLVARMVVPVLVLLRRRYGWLVLLLQHPSRLGQLHPPPRPLRRSLRS